MKPQIIIFSYLFLISIFCSALPSQDAHALNAIASIKSLNGNVQVQRKNHILAARSGLVLNDKDMVKTLNNGRVTLLFRDGSEVRLFANTTFIIEKTSESKGKKRRFINLFKLKLGSLWGKFSRSSKKTMIITPTATAGIKGTNLTLSEQDNRLDVSLSSGKVELENDDQIFELNPGLQVKGIEKTGTFDHKVTPIPYRIQLRAVEELKIPKDGSNELNFTVQLVRTNGNQNVSQSANIYFSSNIDKISFPDVKLNNRGFANFKANVQPFQKADFDKGRIEIYAIADADNNLDIASGYLSLFFAKPKSSSQTLRINASTGELTP